MGFDAERLFALFDFIPIGLPFLIGLLLVGNAWLSAKINVSTLPSEDTLSPLDRHKLREFRWEILRIVFFVLGGLLLAGLISVLLMLVGIDPHSVITISIHSPSP